jgi:hypothetical protein
LYGRRDGAADAQVVEVDDVGVRAAGEQVTLGDGVDLGSVELGAVDRELVGADVDVVLVGAEQGLVAEAWASGVVGFTVPAVVGGVDAVLGPNVGGVPEVFTARSTRVAPVVKSMNRMMAYQVWVAGSK